MNKNNPIEIQTFAVFLYFLNALFRNFRIANTTQCGGYI